MNRKPIKSLLVNTNMRSEKAGVPIRIQHYIKLYMLRVKPDVRLNPVYLGVMCDSHFT